MKFLKLISLTGLAVIFFGCAETHMGRDSVVVGKLGEVIHDGESMDPYYGQLLTLIKLTEDRRRMLRNPTSQFTPLPDVEDRMYRGRTAAWQEKYRRYARALIEKSKGLGYDSDSLVKVLEHIQALAVQPDTRMAFLPVGAYFGTYITGAGPEPVWAVVLQWEYSYIPSRLGHNRAYAFIPRSMKQVGFVTCF